MNSINKSMSNNNLHSYNLLIIPTWSSSLNGNPAAIQITATHINYSETGLFLYNYLWANYQISETEYEFRGENLDYDSQEIVMFGEYSDDKLCINHAISESHPIDIIISRDLDGIISFKITPIMSYGSLEHLSKTINIDQALISTGDTYLSKWNYFISKLANSINISKDKVENTVEEITTIVKQKDDNSEIKTVTTKTSTSAITPENIVSYTYFINFTYGFESYFFEDLKILESKLYFFNLVNININSLEGDVNTILDNIIQNSIPDHIENIPQEIVKGGNTTLIYRLNSSECKLLPNNAYICISRIKSLINEEVHYNYSYRYLFTNTVFNEYQESYEDFDKLNLPITPQLHLSFDKKFEEVYLENEKKIDKPLLKWINSKNTRDNISFEYKLTTKNPNSASLFYDCDGFNLNYNIDLSKLNISENISNSHGSEYNNNLIKSTTVINDNIISKTYLFEINCNTKLDQIQIGAIKTNLLNMPDSPVDDYKLVLSELDGLSNTMMCDTDSIFSVGMHNDGSDEDLEWYGEGGSLSEGYTTKLPENYDDSLASNEGNECIIDEYHKKIDGELRRYFLKRSKYQKQFASEKDDVSETFYEYMNSEESNNLSSSLESRGVAPLLFVTSGYSASNPKKDTSCVWVGLGGYLHAPSQPATGNVGRDYIDVEEIDDKDNFNPNNPYWFIDWKMLNAFHEKLFLGTFLVKYKSKNSSTKYITTNNYFMVLSELNNNDYFVNVVYTEDLIYNKENHRFLPKLGFLNGKVTFSKTALSWKYSSPPELNLNIIINKLSVVCKHYSIGDLIATQLALLAAIRKNTTPIIYQTEAYTLSDEHKNILKGLTSESITCVKDYSVNLNDNINLSTDLRFNDVNLNIWNSKLPSNNLNIASTNNIIHNIDTLKFTPLDNILPDFNNDIYMLEITPDGETSYHTIPNNIDSDTLYYWDDLSLSYKEYTENGAVLYKYGKFSKLTYLGNSELSSTKNPNNYLILDNFDEAKEGFIIFHPFRSSSPKLTDNLYINMDLKYSQTQGLYTHKDSARTGEISFYYKDKPTPKDIWSKESIHHTRKITHVANPPYNLNLFNHSTDIYIYPKERL